MQMSGAAEEEPQSRVYSLFKVMQMPLGMHDRILPLVPPPSPIGLTDPTLLVYPPPAPSNPFPCWVVGILASSLPEGLLQALAFK